MDGTSVGVRVGRLHRSRFLQTRGSSEQGEGPSTPRRGDEDDAYPSHNPQILSRLYIIVLDTGEDRNLGDYPHEADEDLPSAGICVDGKRSP
uniref:Uncharacterized protein n=1 Tax=Peronospora matthiolae TaxID=2874970 RepID=A0AAV1U5E0_9STRA